jgi:predicted Zn finger-like uncharacterized protein
MIDFNCPQCGAHFSVPDNLAGRRARCKKCGTPLAIPKPEPVVTTGSTSSGSASTSASGGSNVSASPSPPPPPPPPRLPPRLRRLKADFEQMEQAFEDFPLIRVRAARGEPPEIYELEYFVKGLERIPGREAPVERSYHLVEIRLTSDYPRMSPQCKMLTPIFHPNIEPGTICVGDHWTAGERLVDLAIRIAELITYQAYNIKSPLDAEAAMWADLHVRELPVDDRNVRPPELD